MEKNSVEDVDTVNIADNTIDRIKGAIYGHALGDACGIHTEFKFKRDNCVVIFPYEDSVKDFEPCDWTDDTDQLIIAMDNIKTSVDVTSCAAGLHKWMKEGFSELGDETGYTNGAMLQIFTNPNFLTNPWTAADEFWQSSGGLWATNGSINRTTVCGLLPDVGGVTQNAADLCHITHADPRCVAGCTVHSMIIHHLCWLPDTPIDDILSASVITARCLLTTAQDEELSNWIRLSYTTNIDNLQLDNTKIDYVFKTLGCSIYALQVIKRSMLLNQTPSFKKFIYKIAGECGVANTNCAIAGATMGAYLGYSKLPAEWLEALPHKKWLDAKVDDFIKRIC